MVPKWTRALWIFLLITAYQPLLGTGSPLLLAILTKGNVLLGAASSVLTIAGYIENKLDNSMQQLKDSMQGIQDRLELIQKDLDDVVKKIEDEAIKTRFFDAENAIRDSLLLEKAYTNTGDPREKDRFLAAAQNLSQKLRILYDGLRGVGLFGGDLLEFMRRATSRYGKCRTNVFKNAPEEYLELINIGLVVYLSSLKMGNADYGTRLYWTNEFKRQEDLVKTRFNAMVQECRDGRDLRGEIGHVLRIHHRESNQQVSQKLYEFLADKYDTDYWFIIIYYEVGTWGDSESRSYSNHHVSSEFTVYHDGSRNAAVIRLPPGAAALQETSVFSAAQTGIQQFCNSSSLTGYWYSRDSALIGNRFASKRPRRRTNCSHYKAGAADRFLYKNRYVTSNMALAIFISSAEPHCAMHEQLKYVRLAYPGYTRYLFAGIPDTYLGLQVIAIQTS